ncbi:sulfite exporter TauE/SafE family protein [Pseudoduganella sp. RAF53_2]|uniref:sulfite exporter TauE/SafE family protein n=1 Tax=unclassified Pseudoduganella TaxID=2637179 RepID=UPI003F94856C
MNLLPVFVVGLAGSVHCAGMCGGIVSAFSMAPGRVIPITPAGAARGLPRVLAYNTGRIASYALAGALAGGLANGAAALAHLAAWQTAAYWMMNLMLALLGLYLMDAWHGLARVEAAGGVLWRHIQPALRPLVPMDTLPKALALGAAWGWVPCGMVYSVLLTAILGGSALNGAAVMAAFGLGTLPMLLAMGLLGARLRDWLRRRQVRVLGGLLVLGFALLGLARAATGVQHGWIDALCLS